MAMRTLQFLLIALGASAAAIAASIWAVGAQTTADVTERLYSAATGWRGTPEAWPATIDSELRFYAALWGAYGLVLVAVGQSLPRRLGWVPGLAAVFFAGGVGRALSMVQVGAPHPVFVVLMAIELALPPAAVLLWWRCHASAQPD
jgi:hypothetical protein